MAQGTELFKNDLQMRATDYIKRFVNVPMTQTQYDALTSYVFGGGGKGTLINKKLTKYLNQGQYGKASFEMDIITSGGGVEGGCFKI